MKKIIHLFMYGLILSAISFQAKAQYTQAQIPQVTKYDLEDLKSRISDPNLYLAHLEELKTAVEQDINIILLQLDIVKAQKTNYHQQVKLLRIKEQILKKQETMHKKVQKDRENARKAIEKSRKQLNNNTDLSYEAKVAYSNSLDQRTKHHEHTEMEWNNKLQTLLKSQEALQNEQLRLEHLYIDIQSTQVTLNHLRDISKIKLKQLTQEIKSVQKVL